VEMVEVNLASLLVGSVAVLLKISSLYAQLLTKMQIRRNESLGGQSEAA
jgi:hypothetical protein